MIQENAVVKEQRNNHKEQSNDVVKKWEEISMKKLSGLTFRYMRYNRKRTLTTLVGIMLSAMLVYLVCGGGYSMYYSTNYQTYVRDLCWDAVFVCDGETAEEILALASESEGSGDYKVSNAWIMQNMVHGEAVLPWIYVSDFSAMPQQLHLMSGVLPKNENEIVISDRFSYSMRLSVGDTYEAAYVIHPDKEVASETQEIRESKKVCGIFDGTYNITPLEESDQEYLETSMYTLMPKDAYRDEKIPVYVRFNNLHGLEQKAHRLAEAYSIDSFCISDNALDCSKGFAEDLDFQFGLFILGFIIECFTLFLIRNAFNISVHERNNDYGILRCVGMSRRQIILIILTEAFWLALAGSLLGVLLGHFIGAGILFLMYKILYMPIAYQMHFSWIAVMMTVLLVFLGAAYAMVAPIEKLYRLNPIAALNKSDMTKKKEIKPNRGKLLTKLFGFEVGYAYKTALRSKSRFLTSLFTLALGTALYIGVSNSFSISIAPLEENAHEDSFREYEKPGVVYDVILDLKKSLQRLNEVKGAEVYIITIVKVIDEEEDRRWEEYIGLSQEMYKRFKTKDAVIDRAHGVERISVTKESLVETVKDKIPALSDWDQNDQNDKNDHMIYVYPLDENRKPIDIEEKDLHLSTDEHYTVMMTQFMIATEIDPMKNLNRLDRFTLENDLYYTGTEDLYEVQSIKSVEFVVKILLIALMIIFFINMINVECSQIFLRKKELEILRIIGMQKKQLSKALYAENLIISILAWFIGSILGCLISVGWYLYNVFVVSMPLVLHISIWSILFPGIILIVAAILTVMIAREEE